MVEMPEMFLFQLTRMTWDLLVPVQWDISGGRGGLSGSHGDPGDGGLGGEGGNGCKW